MFGEGEELLTAVIRTHGCSWHDQFTKVVTDRCWLVFTYDVRKYIAAQDCFFAVSAAVGW